MNLRAGKSFGIHQQRGFWLRCFLERTLRQHGLGDSVVLKGHGFIRAATDAQEAAALAAEGWF
jgi:hypothetical protein